MGRRIFARCPRQNTVYARIHAHTPYMRVFTPTYRTYMRGFTPTNRICEDSRPHTVYAMIHAHTPYMQGFTPTHRICEDSRPHTVYARWFLSSIVIFRSVYFQPWSQTESGHIGGSRWTGGDQRWDRPAAAPPAAVHQELEVEQSRVQLSTALSLPLPGQHQTPHHPPHQHRLLHLLRHPV